MYRRQIEGIFHIVIDFYEIGFFHGVAHHYEIWKKKVRRWKSLIGSEFCNTDGENAGISPISLLLVVVVSRNLMFRCVSRPISVNFLKNDLKTPIRCLLLPTMDAYKSQSNECFFDLAYLCLVWRASVFLLQNENNNNLQILHKYRPQAGLSLWCPIL